MAGDVAKDVVVRRQASRTLSAAVYVMGIESLTWIEARPGYDAYLITRDGMTYWTSGFDRYRHRPSED